MLPKSAESLSQPWIPDGQVSAGSQAGTRLARAGQLGTLAGQGFPLWALDFKLQTVAAAGRTPYQGRYGQSLPLTTSLSLDLFIRDDSHPMLLVCILVCWCSPLLPTWVKLSDSRVHAQFTLVLCFPQIPSVLCFRLQ